jgi:hypothetical protein
MGNRYDGLTNIYVYETRTDQLKAYTASTGKGSLNLRPAWEEQMTKGIRQRDK